MTANTAVKSQNTTGVISIASIPAKEISKQIEFTSKDIKPDSIKIGMLHSAGVISSVLKSLNKIKIKKIILDPVMVTKDGTKLINNESIEILIDKFPEIKRKFFYKAFTCADKNIFKPMWAHNKQEEKKNIIKFFDFTKSHFEKYPDKDEGYLTRGTEDALGR